MGYTGAVSETLALHPCTASWDGRDGGAVLATRAVGAGEAIDASHTLAGLAGIEWQGHARGQGSDASAPMTHGRTH